MSRCKKDRCCREIQGEKFYKPRGVRARDLDTVTIRIDEFEAMRLCDSDGCSQIEAGEKLGVSRGTVQRLLISGRKKLIEGLLNNKNIIIKDRRNKNV